MARSITENLERFRTALIELRGFAERNVRRAEASLKDAKVQYALYGLDHHELGVSIEEARLHEAERFFLVIDERVKEAFN